MMQLNTTKLFPNTSYMALPGLYRTKHGRRHRWHPRLRRLDSIIVSRHPQKLSSAGSDVSIVFDQIPSEVSFEWVYFPPFFFTVVIGFVCTLGVAKLLNLAGVSRVFWHPGLAFVSLWVLVTSLIGLTVISP